MKKLLFFVLFLLLLSPVVAVAADQYYCKCEKPILNGRKCQGNFTTTKAAADACPLCPQLSGDITADKECAEEAATSPTTPSTGVPADSGKTVKLSNPLAGGETDVNAIIGNIIKAAMGVVGALVLLMIVWGGMTWLTAAGNPEKVKSGANTMMWAVLGAVVVLGSYFLLMVILKALAG